ncbi:MAG: DUF2961 domain-containing protein [Armatimonadota bacterium]|nr:DUF2961 domain-containing protein [Armatimonadota bacterium]
MRQIFFSLLLAALIAAPVLAMPVTKGDLLELIDPTQAAILSDSVCEQVSSYDRTGGNDDGFSGAFSYVRKEGENFVIFDSQGPGCVYRIWSANPLNGWVKFYFDGEETPRFEVKQFQHLFQGVDYPFVAPISQNFIGGWCSYVPMPFKKSLKIVAKGPVRFYQINWRKFPDADGVETFNPNYSPEDRIKLARVKRVWNNPGQPPMPFSASTRKIEKSLTIAPNSTADLAKLDGAGMVRGIRLKAVSTDSKFLRKTLFLMKTDGNRDYNIYSPLGDFFLDPFGDGKVQSLLLGKLNDTYYSYFVMPYAKGALLQIKNDSAKRLQLSYELIYEPVTKLPVGMGRFFAWWHRQNPCVQGELFPILNAQGKGQWLGVSHAMKSYGKGIGYLEGDEMLWIDGRDNTHYNGTGTEDYFNGGWYFRTPGWAPLYGCGTLDGSGRCHAYRIHLTDFAPFQQTAKIGIEHGASNKVQADYAGVTFWYAAPETKHGFKPASVDERMDNPAPVKGVIEAENILDAATRAKIITDTQEDFYLSAGKAVVAQPKKDVALTLDAPDTAIYKLEIGFAQGPNRGIASVLIDGEPMAEAVDTYNEAVKVREQTRIGATKELAKGKHTLTIESSGKNAKSTGSSVLIDYIIWLPETAFEGEMLEATSADGKFPVVIERGEAFSGGEYLCFKAEESGASFSLHIPVRKAGKYAVFTQLVRGRRYGLVQLTVDGKPVGEPIDGQSNSAIRAEQARFGELELTAGDHLFTFETKKKEDKNTNYYIGIDTLSLKRLD